MTNSFLKWKLGASFLLFSLFLVSLTKVAYVLSDTFHEGEYLGLLWHLQSYYLGKSQFPVMTHGAMDFIPSLLAYSVYGPDMVIVGTRIVNALAVAITWTIFLDACRNIILLNKASQWWLLFPIAFLFVISSRLDTALLLHWAIIGPRDLFLMMCIWGVLSYENQGIRSAQIIYLSLVAVSCAVAPFWAYDRGIMAAMFGILFIIGLLIRNRFSDATILLLLSIITVIALDYVRIFGNTAELLWNIKYWIDNSSIWRYPFTIRNFAYSLPLILLFLSTLACLWVALRNKPRTVNRGQLIIFCGLIMIEILLLKASLNRPDDMHLSWGIWPSLVIYLFCASRLVPDFDFTPISDGIQNTISGMTKSSVRYLVATFFLLFLCLLLYLTFLKSTGSFIKNMAQPLPDKLVISDEMKNVSMAFSRLEHNCFFGWVNEGVIPLLTHLPYCTRFSYAVFASKNYEDDLLKELEVSQPNAIVFGSNRWSMNIDGRTMDTRLPLVSAFIMKYYPHERVVDSYVIRYR